MNVKNTNGPLILPFNGKAPRIHDTAWIAPNATIIGDVEIGPDASVFYGVVLRGDVNAIKIGARTNIQDNCVLHVDGDAPCTLGEDVTVGHMALVHGATVGDGTLVGMKSALLSRSIIGAGSLIAASAWCSKVRKSRRSPWRPGCRPRCGESFPRNNLPPSFPMPDAMWKPPRLRPP